LRNLEFLGLAVAQRHPGKIVGRQGLQAEPALAAAHLQALVFENQADFRGIRQRAQDFLKLTGTHRHRAITFAASPIGCRGDLDFNIGGEQVSRSFFFSNKDVGKDGQRVTTFDDSRH
jgi:hypothetical protein